MESFALSKIPLHAFSTNPGIHRQLPLPSKTFRSTRCFGCFVAPRSGDPFPISAARNILRGPLPTASGARVLACISSSAALSGSGGADDGLGAGGGGGGGDGDGGQNREETEVKSLSGESEEVSALGSDVIILSVGGMSCGGCAASVKRILESQPQVSSAIVNLETESAAVWVVPEVKATQNWQQQLGEKLANHLTTCGFKSNHQGQGHAIEREIQP